MVGFTGLNANRFLCYWLKVVRGAASNDVYLISDKHVTLIRPRGPYPPSHGHGDPCDFHKSAD